MFVIELEPGTYLGIHDRKPLATDSRAARRFATVDRATTGLDDFRTSTGKKWKDAEVIPEPEPASDAI